MRPLPRPTSLTKSSAGDTATKDPLAANEDEINKLRFSRNVTAFDVVISTLEAHPWRDKNVDILDYFNYGFNEKTWMVS